MDSIFLAELYFRSPKRIELLRELTKYLLLYKKLVVPHIGTFELVPEAACFRTGDQRLSPPGFRVSHSTSDLVPRHELIFLSEESYSDEYLAARQLSTFGKNLELKIQQEPYTWPGLGTLQIQDNLVSFVAGRFSANGLTDLSVQKLEEEVTEDDQHTLHQEDAVSVSDQVISEEEEVVEKRSSLLIPLIVLGILITVIVVVLVLGGFQPQASGLKIR